MTDTEYTRNRCEDRVRERSEVVLWALIAVTALTVRLAGLGRAPLSAAEARQATGAWHAATGQGVPVEGYSPLLLVGNSLLFWVCGGSDALARFLPAVFGSALALTPMLLRRRLGRAGALASGAYLAISPTALVASRQLEGTAMAAAGTMVFLGGLNQFFEADKRGWLAFAAIGLALAVVSGAATYGLLVPLGVAWAFGRRIWPYDRPEEDAKCAAERLGADGTRFLLVFALAALVLSTGLGWNPSGTAAVGSLLVDWVHRCRAVEVPAASPVTLLVVYELLGLALGLGGLAWGLWRGQHLVVLLGLWAGLAVVLLLVMPGRAPTDLLWVVVPLAMLSGLGVQGVAGGQWSGNAAFRWTYAVMVLILWAQVYLMLASYAAFGRAADIVVALVIVGLQAFVGVGCGFALGLDATVRTAAAATGVALLALMVSAGSRVAYGRPGDPREALLNRPTPVNVRDLVETLRVVSWRERGTPTTLDFVYEASENSVLAWYLRDFEMARRVDDLSELHAGERGAIVLTVDGDEGKGSPPGAEYAGQGFPLERQWTPRAVGCRFWEADCSLAFSWFLFRDGPPLPEPELRAILWRSVDGSGVER